jgi:hypothetical protein
MPSQLKICRISVRPPKKPCTLLNPIDLPKPNTPSPPEFGGWGHSGQARRWRSIPSSRRVDQRESNKTHSIQKTNYPKDGVGDPSRFHYIRAVLMLHPLQLSDAASQPCCAASQTAKFYDGAPGKGSRLYFKVANRTGDSGQVYTLNCVHSIELFG